MKVVVGLFVTFLFFILSASTTFSIEEEDLHQESLSDAVNAILSIQMVEDIDQIDCKEVTDDQFEQVGEAWMGERHPDPIVHEQMDQMMGGEGSDSLIQAHIQMGRSYLGCAEESGSWMPMMFGSHEARGGVRSMMGFGGYGNENMMGWGGIGFLGLLFWLVLFVDLILLGIWLWKQINKK